MITPTAPHAPLWRPPGSIPQGMPRLDPTDPVNAGLASLWLPGLYPTGDLGPAQNAPSPSSVGFTANNAGPDGNFNGSSSLIATTTNFGSSPPTSFAILATFSTKIGSQVIAGFNADQNGSGTETGDRILFIGSGNAARFVAIIGGTQIETTGAAPDPTDGRAHSVLVVCVYNGSTTTLSLYIDGVLNASTSHSGAPNASYTNSYFVVGAGSTTGYGISAAFFTGAINQVRLWYGGPVSHLLALAPRFSAADPWPGLIFPSDRAQQTKRLFAVSALAPLPSEARASLARGALLPDEAAATARSAPPLPVEALAALAADAALPAAARAAFLRIAAVATENLAAIKRAATLPAEALVAAGIEAGLPSEYLAALSQAAQTPSEMSAALALVIAVLALPLEVLPPPAVIVSLWRLLQSPGRARLLAPPGWRRLLATPGRRRILRNRMD